MLSIYLEWNWLSVESVKEEKKEKKSERSKQSCVSSGSAAATLLRTSHATCPRAFLFLRSLLFPPPLPDLSLFALPYRSSSSGSVLTAGEVLFHSTCTFPSACQCTAGRRASNNPTRLPLCRLLYLSSVSCVCVFVRSAIQLTFSSLLVSFG